MKYILLILFGISCSFINAQVSYPEKKIKTETTWLITRKGNKEHRFRIQELRYNKDGKIIEEIHYNRKNKILLHKAYQYDKKRLIREFVLDKWGFIIKRIDYTYKNNLLIKKTIFNCEGEMINEEEMIFEYHD